MPKITYHRYSWPGGYENFAILDDGEPFCIPCLNDPTNPTHRRGENDGWKVVAFGCTANEDCGITCVHCNRVIQEDPDDSVLGEIVSREDPPDDSYTGYVRDL